MLCRCITECTARSGDKIIHFMPDDEHIFDEAPKNFVALSKEETSARKAMTKTEATKLSKDASVALNTATKAAAETLDKLNAGIKAVTEILAKLPVLKK